MKNLFIAFTCIFLTSCGCNHSIVSMWKDPNASSYVKTNSAANPQTGLSFTSAKTQAWAIYSPQGTTDLRFYNNATLADQLTLTSSGKIGILNSNPTTALNIGSGNADNQSVGLRVYGIGGTNWKGSAAFGGASNTVIMGELAGIATIGGHNSNLSAWSNLAINSREGNVGIRLGDGVNPTYVLQLGVDSAGKPNGGSWANTSDQRIKKDIEPIVNALDKITLLKGAKFKWRNPEQHANQTGEQLGFIAQEVEKVFPNWVNEINSTGADGVLTDGKVKSLSLPFEFDAYIVEALKELKATVDALKKELDTLKKANNRK